MIILILMVFGIMKVIIGSDLRSRRMFIYFLLSLIGSGRRGLKRLSEVM